MPLLITYDQWMKETHSMIKSRSESLKKIDNAIKARNANDTLKALTAWIDEQNKKGQDWHRSVRNEKTKIVERLAKEVGYMATSTKPMSMAQELADAQAKMHLRGQIRRASQEMFQGRRVVLSNIFLQAIHDRRMKGNQKLAASGGKLGKASALGQDAQAIGSNVNSVRSIATKLQQGIESIVEGIPQAQKSELIEAALGSGAADFALECAPLVGTITSGVKTIKSIFDAASNVWDASTMESRKGDVRPGDAAAALTAIIAIIDNEIVRHSKEAAIHGSAFAAKAAILGAGVPGEAIIGAVEGLLMLLHNLYELTKQYKQMNAANEAIQAGRIDVTIFNTCPILGCYYVVVQGDFTIMNFDVANMGKQNWMQEVVRLKNALEPVKKKALSFIEKSSIIVEGMEKMQGVYQESMWHKISQPFKNKFGDHTPKPGTFISGPTPGNYQLPPISSGAYSEKELQFLKMFEPSA